MSLVASPPPSDHPIYTIAKLVEKRHDARARNLASRDAVIGGDEGQRDVVRNLLPCIGLVPSIVVAARVSLRHVGR